MAQPILMPKPGQMTEECVLVAWHKQAGDPVRRGDVLFEIETDKSIMDVEAFEDGVLLRRDVEDGVTVPVNAVCGYIGQPGEELPPVELQPFLAAPSDGREPEPSADGGRTAGAAAPAAPAAAAAMPTTATAGDGGVRFAISPRAARLAARSGIDAGALRGTGPGGRIVERDVHAALATGAAPRVAAAAPVTVPTPPPVAPFAVPAGEEQAPPVPLSRMRRIIAERLTWSASIPTFTLTVAVDATRLLELRDELRASATTLSITDFILAATARSLAEFPDVNSSTDGQSVWVRRRVHLGLAVAVPEGLVVPVVRDADRMSLSELHEESVGLADAARRGRLAPEQMTGGTFTVSNLGMYGVDEFRAIINPGESAILAVSSLLPTAVAVSGGLAVRQVMRLTLTADHRLVDGELGARFMNAVRRRLEDAAAFRAELAVR